MLTLNSEKHMKKNRFTEAQIIKALKDQESGREAGEICREMGIHKATLYNWKKKYGGMDVTQLSQLKELQEENRKLKAMYADLALDHRIPKEIVEKKNLSAGRKRDIAASLASDRTFPVGRICRVLRVSKTAYYYKSRKDDSQVIEKLGDYAEKMPARGFDEYFKLLRKEGLPWNHKRVKRVYRLMKLNLRRKRKRRLPSRLKEPLAVPSQMNGTWSMDFMHDVLEGGRKIKVFNLIDDFNREALAIEIDTSICGSRVKRVIQQVIEWRGKPEYIRGDNGPEFLSHELVDFCNAQGIRMKYIQPGKPMQNGYIERFNRFYREDVLDAYIFSNLQEVRMLSEEWREFYNNKHPHESLNDMSPREFLEAANSDKMPTHGISEDVQTI